MANEAWHKSQESWVLPDGRVCLTFRVCITPEMVHRWLYYGGRVQVLEPAWLRERVAEVLDLQAVRQARKARLE